MLIQAAIVVISVYPILFIGKIISSLLTDWRWGVPLSQMAVGGIFALLLLEFTLLVPSAAIVIVMVPLGINIVMVISKQRQKSNALNGKYGEEVQWGAELVEQENDQQFANAMDKLPQMELTELGVIAESKEELRNLVIERYEEINNE